MGIRKNQPEGLLGPLETEVMETVWDLGETTVRDVFGKLAGQRNIAYTTVMTTMARLASKGLLARDTSGLAHRYRPTVTREEYARSTVTSVVDWLVDAFPEPAISYFAKVIDDGADVSALEGLRGRIERLREQEG